MAKPKKLNMSLEELVAIAIELNKNTTENKTRNKEDRIPTDKFIRQFGINRKDFSETIKDTEIKYNVSTFMYDIPVEYEGNTLVIPKVIPKQADNSKSEENQQVHQGNTEVIPTEVKPKQSKMKNDSNIKHNEKDVVEAVRNTIEAEYPELKDMIEWFKSNGNEIRNEVGSDLKIDNPKLTGEVVSKSFKTYKGVLDEFVDFSKGRSETQKDLVALALIEFMEKHR